MVTALTILGVEWLLIGLLVWGVHNANQRIRRTTYESLKWPEIKGYTAPTISELQHKVLHANRYF